MCGLANSLKISCTHWRGIVMRSVEADPFQFPAPPSFPFHTSSFSEQFFNLFAVGVLPNICATKISFVDCPLRQDPFLCSESDSGTVLHSYFLATVQVETFVPGPQRSILTKRFDVGGVHTGSSGSRQCQRQ